jgi:hypothetical protein
MAQICSACNEAQAAIRDDGFEPPQHHLIARILRVSGALSNIKTMNKQHLAHISGIIRVIKPMVAHQHVKAVHSAGQERNALTRRGWHFPAFPA